MFPSRLFRVNFKAKKKRVHFIVLMTGIVHYKCQNVFGITHNVFGDLSAKRSRHKCNFAENINSLNFLSTKVINDFDQGLKVL